MRTLDPAELAELKAELDERPRGCQCDICRHMSLCEWPNGDAVESETETETKPKAP